MLASYALTRTPCADSLDVVLPALANIHGHGADPATVKPWVRPFAMLGMHSSNASIISVNTIEACSDGSWLAGWPLGRRF